MSRVDSLIAYGMAEIGKPYVYGDEGPNSFDCSGLMQWIFGKIGIRLPRTAAQQQRYAQEVTTPRAGDLVFWGDPAYHVGLYLGDGRVLTAPKPGATVHVTGIYGHPTYGRVAGLGGVAGAVISPVASLTSGVVSSVADAIGRIGLMVLIGAGGALLIGLGAWQISKGGNDA